MRWSSLKVVLFWGLAFAPAADADGPADELFKLVPADSGMTLAVEDLRGHSREVIGSPLYEGLRRLPVVQAWMASDRFRKAERASRDVQAALGVTPEALRDTLLGDAVVLTLQPAPNGRPEQARGLLLVKVRDIPLAERLLRTLNDAQFRSGELVGLQPRSRGPVNYSARLFKAAGRPSEFYVHFDDGTFAWTNSEGMILGVIDRKVGGGPSLGDDPDFQKVRRGLPIGPSPACSSTLDCSKARWPTPLGPPTTGWRPCWPDTSVPSARSAWPSSGATESPSTPTRPSPPRSSIPG